MKYLNERARNMSRITRRKDRMKITASRFLIKTRPALIVIMLFLSFSATSGDSRDDSKCNLLSPVNTGNVAVAQLHELFGNVIDVCKNRDKDGVVLYLTEHIKSKFLKDSKSEKEYAEMICQYFLRTNAMLQNQPESGDHSIVMEEGRRSSCGFPQSYWMIHTRDEKKERVFRLKLAYEDDKLLINDH